MSRASIKGLVQQLEWSHTLLDGKAVTLCEAEEAVAKLGAGWRLPTIEELRELIDYTRRLPAIDTEAFLDTKNDWYWTSTPVAGYGVARWVIDFGCGDVEGIICSLSACVRAVRDVEEGTGNE